MANLDVHREVVRQALKTIIKPCRLKRTSFDGSVNFDFQYVLTALLASSEVMGSLEESSPAVIQSVMALSNVEPSEKEVFMELARGVRNSLLAQRYMLNSTICSALMILTKIMVFCEGVLFELVQEFCVDSRYRGPVKLVKGSGICDFTDYTFNEWYIKILPLEE